MEAIDYVREERNRQIRMGYDAVNDDAQKCGGILDAARYYAFVAFRQLGGVEFDIEKVPSLWPWPPRTWNPSHDPIRNLIVACALTKAEIDRLKRAGLEDDPVVGAMPHFEFCMEQLQIELDKKYPQYAND